VSLARSCSQTAIWVLLVSPSLLSIKAPTFVIGRYVHLDADLTFRRTVDVGPAQDDGGPR
jgi:hypothetical protein